MMPLHVPMVDVDLRLLLVTLALMSPMSKTVKLSDHDIISRELVYVHLKTRINQTKSAAQIWTRRNYAPYRRSKEIKGLER